MKILNLIFFFSSFFSLFFELITSNTCQNVLLPAYFYPLTWSPSTNLWNKLNHSLSIIIMNPSNGPENNVNTDYYTSAKGAKLKGNIIIGYVRTNYAKQNKTIIKNDIKKYYQQYDTIINGIFFDEVSSSKSNISFYTEIVNYARKFQQTKYVVLNPGVFPDESYIKLANITVVFESDYNSYLTKWNPPSYYLNYPKSSFSHIIYDVSTAALSSVVNTAYNRNSLYVYATNDKLDNPYDTLPPYYELLNSLIKKNCDNNPTNIPTISPTRLPTNKPTSIPTRSPTFSRTKLPTTLPVRIPTFLPSTNPTNKITSTPTKVPTTFPSLIPTRLPTKIPSLIPTKVPTTFPSLIPTRLPTNKITLSPTRLPTKLPSLSPTKVPTKIPTKIPSRLPTQVPTNKLTSIPTKVPSKYPTYLPSKLPTKLPTRIPTR